MAYTEELPKCNRGLDGGTASCSDLQPLGCHWVDHGCEPSSRAHNAWSTPEEISSWIGANFTYDTSRAATVKPGVTPIYTPDELFEKKSGMCVDLARFSYEALAKMPGVTEPKYLMVKFQPCKLPSGGIMARHWMASYRGAGGKLFFMGDTTHPGRIYGPFESHAQFINDCYANLKGRKVEDAQLRDCYTERCSN